MIDIRSAKEWMDKNMEVQKEKNLKLYIKGGVTFLLFMVIALFSFFYFVQ